MSQGILIDTDVIIDYLRDRPDARAYIEGLSVLPATSVVVLAELYSGVRDGAERTALERLLANTTIISLDEATALEGGLMRRQFFKSHGTGLPDALIAATAKLHSLTLITLNIKHFPMLTDIQVPYTKP